MEKVKLTRKQAEAIEHARSGNEQVYVIREQVKEREWFHEYKEFNYMSLETIIKALYNGYEVEETPEDKLSRYHKELVNHIDLINIGPPDAKEKEYLKGKINGIETAVVILGIKIKGINA